MLSCLTFLESFAQFTLHNLPILKLALINHPLMENKEEFLKFQVSLIQEDALNLLLSSGFVYLGQSEQ